MPLFKTIVLWGYTILCLLLFIPWGCAAFILSFLGLRRPMSWFVYGIAYLWARVMVRLTGCAVTVEGRERIPRKGGVCFVSNHGSFFDIILALAYAGRPFGFIAKRELLFIPFLNMWISILGGLFIDRARPRRALSTINAGVRRLKAGAGMLIFPEGHRSRGQGLLPFRAGAFKLATQSGVPIVPVSITGSYEVYERQYLVVAGPVRVVFGAPIPTTGATRQTLADEVRAAIQAGLDAP